MMKHFAFIFSLGLFLCSCSFFQEEPQDDPESIFENLWNTFNDSYAPFEERQINWDSIYLIYRPMVIASTSQEDLYQIITSMLSVLDDGHVQMTVPGKRFFFSNYIFNNKVDDAIFNLDVIEKYYLNDDFIKDGNEYSGYTYGLIQNEIAYLYLAYISDNCNIMNTVLDAYPSSKGIIIDLRHNSGGDFTWAFSNMGRFVKDRTLIFTSKTKNGSGENDYTDWFDWYLSVQAPYYSKKVVVLTDRYTISAGERAAMIFHALPDVTIIGDTTCGALSTMIGRELANGWYYTLATQKVKFRDGISYEGIGMIPDIFIKNDLNDISNGIDATLEKAIAEF